MSLVVRATGPLATVQDLGRPGYAALGVSPSGAADRQALLLANRLLGNGSGAAAVEVTYGGLVLGAERDVVVAVTGATGPLTVAGRVVEPFAPVRVPAGAELVVGRPVAGLRMYVGVRGGVAVDPVLGSRSTDLLGGLGPAPLREGDRLPVGDDVVGPLVTSDVTAARAPSAGRAGLRLVLGPRDDWFTPDALRVLTSATWQVSADSDRVGVRLTGARLARARDGELASEGVVRGAVQVPPSGEPVVFLADHPTTGGYPVVGVLLDADVDRAAQLCPGEDLRLRPVPVSRG